MWCFGHQAIFDFSNTAASIDHPSSMGKTHKYLVSPLFKQNEPVCERYAYVNHNTSNEVAILKCTQLYLPN